MLGLLHRTLLKKGPAHFEDFFQLQTEERHHSTRLASRHRWQLQQPRTGHYLEVVRRSALGLVSVYNLLPVQVVEATSVHDFQRQLQDLLKARATAGCEDWRLTFTPRLPHYCHPLR